MRLVNGKFVRESVSDGQEASKPVEPKALKAMPQEKNEAMIGLPKEKQEGRKAQLRSLAKPPVTQESSKPPPGPRDKMKQEALADEEAPPILFLGMCRNSQRNPQRYHTENQKHGKLLLHARKKRHIPQKPNQKQKNPNPILRRNCKMLVSA